MHNGTVPMVLGPSSWSVARLQTVILPPTASLPVIRASPLQWVAAGCLAVAFVLALLMQFLSFAGLTAEFFGATADADAYVWEARFHAEGFGELDKLYRVVDCGVAGVPFGLPARNTAVPLMRCGGFDFKSCRKRSNGR